MDTTYKSELRELNELNFARFDAKLDQRIAELRAEMRLELGGIREQMRDLKAELIKWAFIFVTGGTLTVLNVLVAVLKLQGSDLTD